jgi:hypothetical protein
MEGMLFLKGGEMKTFKLMKVSIRVILAMVSEITIGAIDKFLNRN